MSANDTQEFNALAVASALHIETTKAPETPAPIIEQRTGLLSRISLVDVALARFGDWKAHAAELHKRYSGVAFDVKTTKGYKEATDARSVIRDLRIGSDKVSKALKSDLRKLSATIGDEAEAVANNVAGLEAHVHDQIVAEDNRRTAERDAERARKGKHELNLAQIRAYVDMAKGKTSSEIDAGIKVVEDTVHIDGTWEEFEDRGRAALAETLTELREMRDQAKARETREEEAERLRIETEAKAREVASIGEIQGAMMRAFGKSAKEVKAIKDELSDKFKNDQSSQVQLTLTTMLATLDMMVIQAEQQEAMKAAATPVTAKHAQVRERATQLLAADEHHAPKEESTAQPDKTFDDMRDEDAEEVLAVQDVVHHEGQQTHVFNDMVDEDEGEQSNLAPTHHQNGAPMYSTTVFKDNGQPIMLDEHGNRSVFCDLCDDGDVDAATTFHVVMDPVAASVEIIQRLTRTMTLDEFNSAIGMQVPAILLVGMGIEFGEDDTFDASEFDRIVQVLIEHLQSLKGKH